MFKDFDKYDGLGLAALVKKGDVSAGELLDEAIARTDAIDPTINAVVVRHDDYARQQISRGLPQGPFSGVPFLLKDLNTLAGTRTTSGSTLYKNFVAQVDNTITKRFLAAGVTIYGKTASPEFGLMPTTETRLFGPTRNHRAVRRRPSRRVFCQWPMRPTVAAPSAFRPPPAACSA